MKLHVVSFLWILTTWHDDIVQQIVPLFLIHSENRRVGEESVAGCTRTMGTLVKPALLLLLWQSVWTLDVPLEGESVT